MARGLPQGASRDQGGEGGWGSLRSFLAYGAKARISACLLQAMLGSWLLRRSVSPAVPKLITCAPGAIRVVLALCKAIRRCDETSHADALREIVVRALRGRLESLFSRALSGLLERRLMRSSHTAMTKYRIAGLFNSLAQPRFYVEAKHFIDSISHALSFETGAVESDLTERPPDGEPDGVLSDYAARTAYEKVARQVLPSNRNSGYQYTVQGKTSTSSATQKPGLCVNSSSRPRLAKPGRLFLEFFWLLIHKLVLTLLNIGVRHTRDELIPYAHQLEQCVRALLGGG